MSLARPTLPLPAAYTAAAPTVWKPAQPTQKGKKKQGERCCAQPSINDGDTLLRPLGVHSLFVFSICSSDGPSLGGATCWSTELALLKRCGQNPPSSFTGWKKPTAAWSPYPQKPAALEGAGDTRQRKTPQWSPLRFLGRVMSAVHPTPRGGERPRYPRGRSGDGSLRARVHRCQPPRTQKRPFGPSDFQVRLMNLTPRQSASMKFDSFAVLYEERQQQPPKILSRATQYQKVSSRKKYIQIYESCPACARNPRCRGPHTMFPIRFWTQRRLGGSPL